MSRALQLGAGKESQTVMLVSQPVALEGRFLGMIGVVIDQQLLINRLHEVSQGGLLGYVVDRQGRLVAGGVSNYLTGQDMREFAIVKDFVDQQGRARLVATREFESKIGNESVEMLGTYTPVPALEWAVVAQKPRREAYRSIFEMQSKANWLAVGLDPGT